MFFWKINKQWLHPGDIIKDVTLIELFDSLIISDKEVL